MTDLRRNEPAIVKSVYNQTATLNGVRSLASYELRAHRFARIADSRPATDAGTLRARAAAIRADVSSATSRAAALVVRRRTGRVVKSFWSAVFFLAFAAGVVMFAIASDRLDSARAGQIATAKACAEARTANARENQLPGLCGNAADGAAGAAIALAKACADARAAKAIEEKLPGSCGDPPKAAAVPEVTPAAILDAAFVALSEQRRLCLAAARKAGAGADGCASLNTALAALMK